MRVAVILGIAVCTARARGGATVDSARRRAPRRGTRLAPATRRTPRHLARQAGYPILTVPAGYGTGNAGRNPIGVAFVGGAFGEGELLAAGYAFEQATNVRLAPSFTNPSMWRCVPGSDFFSPHHCHPGDLLASK